MGWIMSVLGAVFIFAILTFVAVLMRKSDDDDVKKAGNIFRLVAYVLLGVWLAVDTALAATVEIPYGNVGVISEFGSITSQVAEGFHVVPPWAHVERANIQVQRHLFDKLDAFSAETQDVFVVATLNVRVSPMAIQQLYRSVGPRYFDILIAPRVEQNFKDETVKYKSVDIAPSREIIRRAVRGRLEKELAPYSIEVDDLLLNNIDFRPEFKTAIEAKQVAMQQALEEEQRVAVAQRKAEQAVKTAEGQGQAILTVAQKQAEANTALSKSLTPQLIQYSLIQKLGDQVKVILLPSNQPFILGPNLLDEKP